MRAIFERALGLPVDQRAQFLDDACNEDDELRRDVIQTPISAQRHRFDPDPEKNRIWAQSHRLTQKSQKSQNEPKRCNSLRTAISVFARKMPTYI